MKLSTGERIHYDKLVIATGARPDSAESPARICRMSSASNTLADTIRLKHYLVANRPRRAVVVGGGYIGLEAADSLRRNGLAVTVLQGARTYSSATTTR